MIAPRARSHYPDDPSLSKLLLVEGETPANFFEALATHLGINATIEIRSFGGNQNLQPVLSALVKSHGFALHVKSLGISRDAESSITGARQSVQSALRNSGVPETLKQSVFILPDDVNSGMLETLLLQSVSSRPYFHCVEDFLTSAQNDGAILPGGFAIDKCRLQVYMAAHQDPQIHPGTAARKGFWPLADPVFQPVRDFLQSL